MDLFNKKILFQASKENLFTVLGTVICGILSLWEGWSFLFQQSTLYPPIEKDFSVFCMWFNFFAVTFVFTKIILVKQFYIAEDGFILREGLSGKWHVIDFDKIITATIEKSPKHCYGITIYCNKNEKFNIDTQDYVVASLDKVAEALNNKNILICKNFIEAKDIVASYTPEELKELGDSEPPGSPCYAVYLHCFVPFLPLLIAGYFYCLSHPHP